MSVTYKMAKSFKKRYPLTVAWRLKQHSKVIDKHLNDGEEVLYVFMGQKNHSSFDFVNTNLVVLTNKRLMIATKRLLFGYFFIAITPDMFNDLKVTSGIIWGKIYIDTIKEFIVMSHLAKDSLDEIESAVSGYMMEEKKKYHPHDHRH